MTALELTPAEQAATDVLTRELGPVANVFTAEALENMARAALAAVRGLLFEEAADLIERSDRLRSLTDDHMRDIEMAAEELRRAATLSRPTAEEN